MELKREHLEKLRSLMEGVKRVKAGKSLTREQQTLLKLLDKGEGKDESGAPRGASRSGGVIPAICDSIGQAAAVTGAPLAMLKAAKREGCKAFLPGSRVETAILLPFLFGMLTKGNKLPSGMSSPVEWLTTVKAQRETLRLREEERSMMPTADAKRQAGEACSYFFAELERAERELPPALAGRDAVSVYKWLHQFVGGLRKASKEKFEAVGE